MEPQFYIISPVVLPFYELLCTKIRESIRSLAPSLPVNLFQHIFEDVDLGVRSGLAFTDDYVITSSPSFRQSIIDNVMHALPFIIKPCLTGEWNYEQLAWDTHFMITQTQHHFAPTDYSTVQNDYCAVPNDDDCWFYEPIITKERTLAKRTRDSSLNAKKRLLKASCLKN